MVLGTLKWLLGGLLVSSGLVGYLTGLLLVPFGFALALSAARSHRGDWPGLFVGLGLGPAVLLGGDVVVGDAPTGAVSAFWLGIALLLAGIGLSVYGDRRARQTAL